MASEQHCGSSRKAAGGADVAHPADGPKTKDSGGPGSSPPGDGSVARPNRRGVDESYLAQQVVSEPAGDGLMAGPSFTSRRYPQPRMVSRRSTRDWTFGLNQPACSSTRETEIDRMTRRAADIWQRQRTPHTGALWEHVRTLTQRRRVTSKPHSAQWRVCHVAVLAACTAHSHTWLARIGQRGGAPGGTGGIASAMAIGDTTGGGCCPERSDRWMQSNEASSSAASAIP